MILYIYIYMIQLYIIVCYNVMCSLCMMIFISSGQTRRHEISTCDRHVYVLLLVPLLLLWLCYRLCMLLFMCFVCFVVRCAASYCWLPKVLPDPLEKNSLRCFFRSVCPLGVVVRFRAVFTEHIALWPYGQQFLKFFCSWDRKSLEHTSSSYFE